MREKHSSVAFLYKLPNGLRPACKPEGRQFDSQSGHMPGSWARSPVGGVREATN